RLDVREDTVGKGVIVPGHPEKSRLVDRIFSDVEALRMPPAASHKQLSAAQKDLLKRWIAEGAKYQPHWAFVPLPASVPVPVVPAAWWADRSESRGGMGGVRGMGSTGPATSATSHTAHTSHTGPALPPTPRAWIRSPVDAFVLARLQKEGLRPSPEA